MQDNPLSSDAACPDLDELHYLRRIVDNSPSLLAYWGADLRCRFANQAYAHWFGVDPGQLVGTSIEDLLGAELVSLNQPYMARALEGKEQLFERVVAGKDGVHRHSLASPVGGHYPMGPLHQARCCSDADRGATTVLVWLLLPVRPWRAVRPESGAGRAADFRL